MSARARMAAARATPGETESQLIERARTGDAAAFRAIYDAHVDLVYRRLGRLLGRDPDCEDLIQDVFLSLHRMLPRFRGEASLATVLYRIAINTAYMHLRRHRRRVIVPLETDGREPVHPSRSPEEAVREREIIDRVLACAAELHPKKRIALLLHYVEGLSFVEIADLVGASADTVRKRVEHGLDEVTRRMRKGGGSK